MLNPSGDPAGGGDQCAVAAPVGCPRTVGVTDCSRAGLWH